MDAEPSPLPATAQSLRRAVALRPLVLQVEGQSMGAALPDGGRVRIGAAGAPPAAGELWAYWSEDSGIVVHRCVGRDGDQYCFRGDSAESTDPAVADEQLIGPAEVVQ